MKNPVIGIGLEGCDPVLLEKWMSQGHLQNLEKVRQQGVYGRLVNTIDYHGTSADFFATEPSWGMFLTGCFPSKTGFWDVVRFNPDRYQIVCDKIYTDPAYPPFYALDEQHQVITFDMPVTRLSDKLNGMQVQGWGGHFPTPPSGSLPTNLLSEIISKYGEDPLKYKDDGKWWNQKYIDWVQGAVAQSSATRVKICRDLLQRQPFDLFLTVFGDIHAAGHDLYDQSQPDHLLYPVRRKKGNASDPLLEAYKAMDRAIGELLEALPEEVYVMFFSIHGMAANHTDVLSMFTLPELLYRLSFSGKVGFAQGQPGKLPAPITKPVRKGWSGEIWRMLKNANPLQRLVNTWAPKRFARLGNPDLLSPYELGQQQLEMNWCPTMMYASVWKQMKAFAIPAFANGHIRINLQGREKEGVVPVSDYDAVCQDIMDALYQLKDGRTGKPMVKQVIKTRQSASDAVQGIPENLVADLVVVWHEVPTDVVDSPNFGRIGPVTLNRPGGHRPRGFLLGKGPGITPGSTVTGGHIIDLPPTLLKLMNAPVPEYFDGKPLVEVAVPVNS